MCVHIIATLLQKAVSKHSREAQRHLAFFVHNLESNAENQISSAEEPRRLVKIAKGVRRTLMLAKNRFCRIVLHLICLANDGKWRWHWAGVCRELHSNHTHRF